MLKIVYFLISITNLLLGWFVLNLSFGLGLFMLAQAICYFAVMIKKGIKQSWIEQENIEREERENRKREEEKKKREEEKKSREDMRIIKKWIATEGKYDGEVQPAVDYYSKIYGYEGAFSRLFYVDSNGRVSKSHYSLYSDFSDNYYWDRFRKFGKEKEEERRKNERDRVTPMSLQGLCYRGLREVEKQKP